MHVENYVRVEMKRNEERLGLQGEKLEVVRPPVPIVDVDGGDGTVIRRGDGLPVLPLDQWDGADILVNPGSDGRERRRPQ